MCGFLSTADFEYCGFLVLRILSQTNDTTWIIHVTLNFMSHMTIFISMDSRWKYQNDSSFKQLHLQGDQLITTVCLWYLVKTELSSVHMYTWHVTFYKVPEKHGHFYLVTLYINFIYWCHCYQRLYSCSWRKVLDVEQPVLRQAPGVPKQDQVKGLTLSDRGGGQ